MAAIHTPSSRSNGITLSRSLGLIDVTLIGIGATIGAGIFVLTGFAAGQAGPALLLAFVLNGLLTSITAASYAELGASFPETGGGYMWGKQGLGGLLGFLSGWISWFAHCAACSLYALGFGAYLAELLPAQGWLGVSAQDLHKPFAIAAAILFAFINYRGVRGTSRAGNLVTLIKVATLGVFVLFGLAALGGQSDWPSRLSPFFATGAGGVMAAMSLTFVAFQGYDIIAHSGDEVRHPQRNIPRAIFLSVAISLVIYVCVAFVALAAVNGQGQPTWQFLGAAGELALVDAARQLVTGGSLIVIAGGLLSMLSALNVTIYSSSRVSFAMGRDKALPDQLGSVHSRRRTPHWSIAISTALIVGVAAVLSLETVAYVAGLMFMLLLALVNASAIRLRRKRPELSQRFRMPWMPVLPGVGIVLLIGLAAYLITLSSSAGLWAAAWIGAGTLMYYGYVRQRETVPHAPVIEAHMEFTRDFRVLLPLAKPERVDQLAPLATALAAAGDGEVLSMHVEVVPPQLPLRTGRRFAERARPVLQHAEQVVSAAGVPAHSMIRVGHDAVSGIVEAVHEIKADVLVMAWRPKPRTRDRLLGPTLDPLLANPPCDVLVLRAGSIGIPQRIVVPLAGGPNAKLALKYALLLAERWDARVVAMTIVGTRATAVERTAAEKMLREAAGKRVEHPRLAMQVVEAASPEEGILSAAGEGDLLMVGASRESAVNRVLFGDLPERVAASSSAAVIIVKQRVGPVTSGLRRALDWISARIPRLTQDRLVDTYKSIRRAARPDADYFVMIGLASGIASLGLLLNSPAVIIGAMLVAPLMAAIVGLGMGVVMGDLRLLRLAANATLQGMLLAIGVGIVAGWLAIDSTPTAEILSRTQPSLLDLGVALLSGAAGAYALCREDVSASLPGVAIAAALVPPLATAGIGISTGEWRVAGGALLLFFTNLVAIAAASAVIFLLFGFRPDAETERITVFQRGALAAGVLLAIVAVALGALTINLIGQVRFNQDVRSAIETEVATLNGAQLVEFKIDPLVQNEVHLEVTIRSTHSVSYEETVAIQKGIASRLNRTVALLLTVVPTTQLDPFVPPTPTSTPTPGPTSTPTPTLTPTLPATDTPTPSATPTATATHTPTPTSTPLVVGVIANTNGRGVLVHASPDGPTFTAWREGTPVTVVLVAPIAANGRDWLKVRDASGVEGWVAAEYVSIAP